MEPIERDVEQFIQLLSSGDSLSAMERFYDEEVVVFENRTLARAGKEKCLEFERNQLANQPLTPDFKLTSHAVNPKTDHAFIQYTVRFADSRGRRMRLEEVAVQKWHKGKIIEERFYYEGVVDEGDEAS